MNANEYKVDIKQVHATCFIAYEHGSRQAIWETISLGDMLAYLKSKGYSEDEIFHKTNRSIAILV